MSLSDEIVRMIKNAPKAGEEGIAVEIRVKNRGEKIEALAHATQFGTRIVIRIPEPVVVDDWLEQRLAPKNSEVF